MATIFKGWCHLGFSNGYTTVRNDASCLKQDYSNRPTDFTAGTKTEFITKNGGHLEKWAPYWILKKLQNSKPWFQQPMTHAKRHQNHLIRPTQFNSVNKTMHLEKMGDILNFQMTNLGKFDQKHQLNRYHNLHDCYQILLLAATLNKIYCGLR